MIIKEFLEKECIDYLEHEELVKHTTYKVGGQCDYYVLPKTVDTLVKLLKFLDKNSINYKVLGNGSNVIVSSTRYNGVIISLSNINNIEINDNVVKVGAGFSLIKLSNYCANNNLGGIEFASGIPACVGGAIYMNAGAYKSDMSEVLINVTYIDDNYNVVTKPKNELDFSYRHSIFQEKKYIIVGAEIQLYPADRDEILTIMNDRRQRRIETQPLEYPSAGSVFRNPAEDIYAGKLIEDLGLKGYSIGGAKVSEKHANFIVNYNNATSDDIKKLIDLIKEKVKEKYNIELRVEQEFVNFGE
ncbi:MAG: UDP-N-acetylmuramate dehydrogenase [Bacilli bacterium]|nr:UDP-N-acetylmuramate dehydrogenase [Bacilli bacterium]